MKQKERDELSSAKNKYVEASAQAILEGNLKDAEESMKVVSSIDKVLANTRNGCPNDRKTQQGAWFIA